MKRERTMDRQGLWLIAGSFAVLAGVAGLVAWREAQAPQLDPVTLCASGKPIAGEVMVLLDVTDSLSAAEAENLVGWLQSFERAELRANDRLSLWVLGPGRGLERRFSRCYPGRESDPILHNPAMSAASCDSLFSRPLRSAVLAAVSSSPSPVSPILEAIRELSEQAGFADRTGGKRITLISDLRQNTRRVSLYRDPPGFEAFRSAGHYERVRADLNGADVTVLYVNAPGTDGGVGAKLREFWRAYFDDCGAHRVHFQQL